ncbi:MAG: TIGR-Tas system RNA-guided endonuclease, partial [Candidatus Thorarchaeota archaeon]
MEERPFRETTELRALVGSYYDIQKGRIGFENRTRAVKQRKTELTSDIKDEQSILKSVERSIEKRIKTEIEKHAIYTEWLKGIKGIGPVLAGGLIAYIERYDPETDTVDSIERFPRVSNLWSYVGLGDPKQKRRKGVQSKHSSNLKTHCWKIAKSLVMSGKREGKLMSDYAKLYMKKKAYYTKNNKPFEIHIDDAKGYCLADDIGSSDKGTNISHDNCAKIKGELNELYDGMVNVVKTKGHIDAMAKRYMV